MLKKISLVVSTLALMLVMSGADVMAQTKRISFRAGCRSATVSGRIGEKGYREYIFNGRAGQVMTIKITSGNNAVTVNAGSAAGESFSLEMTGGDHLLSIVNTKSGATNYTLTVSIK